MERPGSQSTRSSGDGTLETNDSSSGMREERKTQCFLRKVHSVLGLLLGAGVLGVPEKADALTVCAHTPFPFIFYHVPKAGGTSVSSLLRKRFRCQVFLGMIRPANARRSPRTDVMHLTPDELPRFAQQIPRLKQLLSQHDHWPSVAMVRNPFTRAPKAFVQRKQRLYEHVWGNDYPHSFEPFMRWLNASIAVGNISWSDATLTHFRPAWHFTHSVQSGERVVQHILRFEHATEEVQSLLGLHTLRLPFLHGGFRKRYRSSPMHSNRTRSIVQQLYQQDIHLFGYSADGAGASETP